MFSTKAAVDLQFHRDRTLVHHRCIEKKKSEQFKTYFVKTAFGVVCVIVALTLCYRTLLGLQTKLPFLSYKWNECYPLQSATTKPDNFKQCSINNFLETGLPFLNDISAIPVDEFVERRNRLAVALAANDIDAFVVEPGYTFKYYNNISQTDWEPWEPEERPFLAIVRPQRDSKSGHVKAETFFLAPAFEAERVRLLGMPFTEPSLKIIEWEEHWNPYSTLLASEAFESSSSWKQRGDKPVVMVDDEMRDFIQRGLGENGFKVIGLRGDVEQVREIKSKREIEILRAVNTGTVEAMRQMRKCLHQGLSENDVKDALDSTLKAGGLEPFFDIVLFDDDASNPHGGTSGAKTLGDESLVLIDVGAHLHGYSSDVARTFFPPYVPKPSSIESDTTHLPPTIQEKMKLWAIVNEAQEAAMHALKPNRTAASVDVAARRVIEEAGYGKAFTHRLGHGIGIKAHEPPYLNKGNTGTTLRAGMAFAAEPGIYLVDRFGVRTEDIFLVNEDSESGEEVEPSILSGTRATGLWDL